MIHDSFLKKTAIVLSVLLVSGCASTRISDEDLTPQQRQIREQQKTFNKTVGQGALWGAAIGGIAAALLGGNKRDVATAAAAGAAVGAIGGSYFAKKQKEYASQELALNSMIEDAQKRNAQTAQYVAECQDVLNQDKKKLAMLTEQAQDKTLEKKDIKKQIAIVQQDSDLFSKAVASTDQYIEMFKGARDQQLKTSPGSDVSVLDREIASLQEHKAAFANMVSSLKSELDSFPAS